MYIVSRIIERIRHCLYKAGLFIWLNQCGIISLISSSSNEFNSTFLLPKKLFNKKESPMKVIICVGMFLMFPLLVRAQQTTAIPDTNFEKALIQRGLDSGPIDGFVYTDSIVNVGTLFIPNREIRSMEGIQDFQSLYNLHCGYNLFDTLDVSNLDSLAYLSCDAGELRMLKALHNPSLQILFCRFGSLNAMDLSGAPELKDLICSNNKLTYLNLNNNTKLKRLRCHWNRLTSLDIENCQELGYLNCEGNQFTQLDLSQNKALSGINYTKNRLTCLNLKNGKSFEGSISANRNPDLRCIQVSNPTLAFSSNDQAVLAGISFSTDCGYECSNINGLQNDLITGLESIKVYPNPGNGMYTIEFGQKLERVNLSVFNRLGEEIINDNHLFTDHIYLNVVGPKGIYFVSIQSELGVVSRLKLVKD